MRKAWRRGLLLVAALLAALPLAVSLPATAAPAPLSPSAAQAAQSPSAQATLTQRNCTLTLKYTWENVTVRAEDRYLAVIAKKQPGARPVVVKGGFGIATSSGTTEVIYTIPSGMSGTYLGAGAIFRGDNIVEGSQAQATPLSGACRP